MRIRTRIPFCLGLLWVALAAGPAFADPPPGRFYIADSTLDIILCAADLDGSGDITADEVVRFFAGPFGDDTLSIATALIVLADGTVVVLDGGTNDVLLALRDLNADGDADDSGEQRVIRSNAGAGAGMSTPNALALSGDTIFVSDDGARQKWVLALRDLDGDGDFEDDGEAVVAFDATNASGVAIEDPESLAVAGDAVYVGDTANGSIIRLRDLDGDGDFQDAGEASIFATLPTPIDLDAIAADGDVLYAVNEDDGTVYRIEDADGDGVASAEEISEHLAADARLRDPNDMIAIGDGYLAAADGQEDAVGLAKDLDGDGNAMGDGEFVWYLNIPDLLSTPSAIAFAPVPRVDVEAEFLRGDANLDGRVDLSDAVSILGYLFLGGDPPICLDVLDADDTSVHNIADAIYLLNFLFSGGPQPPMPYPDAGPDPTADDFDCPVL